MEAIARAVDWDGEVVSVPTPELPEALRSGMDLLQDVVMDSTRIRRELRFVPPVPLEQALARTIEWTRRRPS